MITWIVDNLIRLINLYSNNWENKLDVNVTTNSLLMLKNNIFLKK